MVDDPPRNSVPGRGYLAHTPGSFFTVTYGNHVNVTHNPPRADTHVLPLQSNMIGALNLAVSPRKGPPVFDDPVREVLPCVPDGDDHQTECLTMPHGPLQFDDDPYFWAILDRAPTKVLVHSERAGDRVPHPPTFHPVRAFTNSNATTRSSPHF